MSILLQIGDKQVRYPEEVEGPWTLNDLIHYYWAKNVTVKILDTNWKWGEVQVKKNVTVRDLYD